MKKTLYLSIYFLSIFCFGQKKIYFDAISDFHNGYAIVKKGNITTFIDSNGEELNINDINLKLTKNGSTIGMQKNGFFINTEQKGISFKGEDGIKNIKGDYIVEPKYRITILNDYFILKDISDLRNISYNILDDKCNSIFKTKGSFKNEVPIIPLTNDIVAISNNDTYPYRYKLVFIKEDSQTDFIYGDFGNTKNGFIKASKYIKNDGKFKWGFLDLKGQKAIDFIYTKPPGDFENSLAVVKNLDNKFGYINDKNEIVIEPTLVEAYGFVNNKALVRIHKYKRENGKIDNGYRIINTKGEVIYNLNDLKPNYTPYDYYKKTIIEKDDILRIKNSKSKYFILNLENLELNQTEFTQINEFDSSLSLVKFYNSERKSQEGYINKKGELILIKAKKEF